MGGTWLENTYPGAGVDTPTHLYSLSFAQQPDWSRYFAKRDELNDYLQRSRRRLRRPLAASGSGSR